jgi:hypothetical protein
MSIVQVIEKLDATNKEQKLNLEQLHEQFVDLKADPRFVELPIDDLENLFLAYLKTWIKSNTEIKRILLENKK